MSEQKAGGVVLLSQEHHGMKNPWGFDVVGWNPTSEGTGGIFNPKGWGFLRVVLWKLGDDGERIMLYDQPIVVENPGAIIIAELDGKIALAQNFRMIGERLWDDATADYIKRLNSDQQWGALMEVLGGYSWEAPRGMIQGDEGAEDVRAFILKTAKTEAMEEAGLTLEDSKIVGRVNWNTSFAAHAQYVVYAKISSMGEAIPENLEIIKGTQLFTMDELRELNQKGKFVDGLTLAAMALCGLSLNK